MTSIPVTKARSKLYQLLDAVAGSHEPIQITGKRSNAVLVSEEDWRSIQETLYLMSIPGMRDSILQGDGRVAQESAEEARLVSLSLYTRQAQKDARKVASANLRPQART
jgi:antitoxin YefM